MTNEVTPGNSISIQKYTKMLETIQALTTPFVSNQKIGYRDRQGLLLNEARSLGTCNDMKRCVYNESHEVTDSRFREHLLKCREANQEKANHIIVCQFDASHHIPVNQYNNHLQYCRMAAEAKARHVTQLSKVENNYD